MCMVNCTPPSSAGGGGGSNVPPLLEFVVGMITVGLNYQYQNNTRERRNYCILFFNATLIFC